MAKEVEELGGKIVMKAPVREITQHDEGVVVKSDAGIFTGHYTVVAMPPCLTGRITYDPPLPRERNQVPQRSPMGAVVKILAFYGAPHWRTEGAPLSEQVTFALNPHAFNADHHLYIDSVYDVSPPGGPGVLASFLWNDDAFELLNKVSEGWPGFICFVSVFVWSPPPPPTTTITTTTCVPLATCGTTTHSSCSTRWVGEESLVEWWTVSFSSWG